MISNLSPMFFKLITTPLPPIEHALDALDAAREVCSEAEVPPLVAWRDSLALQVWYSSAHPEGMVSDEEIKAAGVWNEALAAARAVLGLPEHVAMDIELITALAHAEMPEQHGPDRYTWRRNWTWYLEKWAEATLDKLPQDRN